MAGEVPKGPQELFLVKVFVDMLRLWKLILKYGHHQGMCHSHGGRDCNCGWDEVKDEAEKFIKEKETPCS